MSTWLLVSNGGELGCTTEHSAIRWSVNQTKSTRVTKWSVPTSFCKSCTQFLSILPQVAKTARALAKTARALWPGSLILVLVLYLVLHAFWLPDWSPLAQYLHQITQLLYFAVNSWTPSFKAHKLEFYQIQKPFLNLQILLVQIWFYSILSRPFPECRRNTGTK